jgi:Uma2 family endonuclease
VRVASPELYTYPDVAVARRYPQFLDGKKDTLLNPIFLAEVLSPSTETYDCGRRFESYRTLDSLLEYLLIAQDRLSADLYTRNDNRVWRLRGARRLEEIVDAQSTGCRIAMSGLYEDVVLPPAQETGELR